MRTKTQKASYQINKNTKLLKIANNFKIKLKKKPRQATVKNRLRCYKMYLDNSYDQKITADRENKVKLNIFFLDFPLLLVWYKSKETDTYLKAHINNVLCML